MPHGEYSTSNVGNVDAYSGFGSVVGGSTGDKDRCRLRLGVMVAVVGVCFGVILATSLSANSCLVNGVLLFMSRADEYGCGVATTTVFSLSRFRHRLWSSVVASVFRRLSRSWRFLRIGRFMVVVPSDRRLGTLSVSYDCSDDNEPTRLSFRLVTVHLSMLMRQPVGMQRTRKRNK